MPHATMSGAQQATWWQIIKLTHARWSEVDGDQRAAAFAYYLLLSISSSLGLLGICFCAARSEIKAGRTG